MNWSLLKIFGKRSLRPLLLILASCIWVFCSPPLAQDATVDPGKSDLNFRFQGEYSTPKEDLSPLGLQVRALGGGKFDGILSTGGLPGAGWNGQSRTIVTGMLQGQSLVLTDAGFVQINLAEDGSSADLKLSGRSVTLPKIIRKSVTLAALPPQNARILFDGTNLTEWTSAVIDSQKLLLPQGTSSSGGALSKRSFQDFTLHLEFQEPFMPTRTGTSRGNSGVYLQNRYELQILDSFGHIATDSVDATRHCGAFWEMDAPKLNMCLPPLSWQTYDIEFTAARYDASGKTQTAMATVTVQLNGVTIHDHLKLRSRTLLGLEQGPDPLPLRLQYYGDAVLYRNIWIVEGTPAPVLRQIPKRSGYLLNLPKSHWPSLNQRYFLEPQRLANGRSIRVNPVQTVIYLATH